MAENSKIEWTDHTFNPWVGCTKISPACDNCYAESWAKRTGGAHLWQGERRRTTPANWQAPMRWNRDAERDGVRRKVFCASLADVFDNQVPEWKQMPATAGNDDSRELTQ
jgi:protein gp37